MKSIKTGTDKIMSAEYAIGHLLRGGVFLSGSLIFIGLFLKSRVVSTPVLESASPSTDVFRLLRTGVEIPTEMVRIPQGAQIFDLIGSGTPNAWITLGIIVLIGLPVIRVALAGFVFLLQKDFIFVFFCALVLMNLAFGLMSRSIL